MFVTFSLVHFFIFSLQHKELHFPKDMEDLSETAEMLKQYRADHFSYITLLFCSAYLYKQTFAIPGSVFMVRHTDTLSDQAASSATKVWIPFFRCMSYHNVPFYYGM